MNKFNYLALAYFAFNFSVAGFAHDQIYIRNATMKDCYILPLQDIDCHMEGSKRLSGVPEAGSESYSLKAGTLLRIVPGLLLRFDFAVEQLPGNRALFELRTTVEESPNCINIYCSWQPSATGFVASHSLLLPEGLTPQGAQAIQEQGSWAGNHFTFTGRSSGQAVEAVSLPSHGNAAASAASSAAAASWATKKAPKGTKRRADSGAPFLENEAGSAAASSSAAAAPIKRPMWQSPDRNLQRANNVGFSPTAQLATPSPRRGWGPPTAASPGEGTTSTFFLFSSPEARRVSFEGLEAGLQLTATSQTTGRQVDTFLSPQKGPLRFSLPAGTALAMSLPDAAHTSSIPPFSLENLGPDQLGGNATGTSSLPGLALPGEEKGDISLLPTDEDDWWAHP